MTDDEYKVIMPQIKGSLTTNNGFRAPSVVTPFPLPPKPTGIIISPPPIISFETIPSIFDGKDENVEYIVPGILSWGSNAMISGDSGAGKSSLVAHLCDAVANGKSFLGFPAQPPCKVLYLDRENPRPGMIKKFKRLHIADGGNFRYWGRYLGEVPHPIDIAWINNERLLIILDSYTRFFTPFGKQRDEDDTAKFFSSFDPLKYAGHTNLFLHHTGKGENTKEFRGSTDIKANLDWAYVLTNAGGIRLTDLTLTPFKMRETDDDPIEQFSFRYHDGLFINCESSEQIQRALWNLLVDNKEMNSKAIETHSSLESFGRNNVRAALSTMVKAKTVLRRDGPHNSDLYSLIFRSDVEGMEQIWREKSSSPTKT